MRTIRWRIPAKPSLMRWRSRRSRHEGGKRLRALLTLDAFRAFAPQDVAERDMDAVLDLACAT